MDLTLVKFHISLVFCFLTFLHHTVSLPVSNMDPDLDMDDQPVWTKEYKKSDAFSSRGWAAGGMPFNVLYSQNAKLTRLAPIATLPIAEAAPVLMPEPQALRSPRREPISYKFPSGRRQYSVLPQLFVSYGWGPVEK